MDPNADNSRQKKSKTSKSFHKAVKIKSTRQKRNPNIQKRVRETLEGDTYKETGNCLATGQGLVYFTLAYI